MSVPVSIDIEFRRLNNDEISLIYSLQEQAKDLLAYYNEHEHRIWLKRALNDIRAGTRIALGAFTRRNALPQLVGSAILKRGARQHLVELKNFIVSDAGLDNHPTDSEKVRAIFLRNIERFCSVRGFSTIGIELPADFTSYIAFFLNNHFRVTDALKSRYREEDYHYFLEKDLDRTYAGDPFDYFSMARWLVHERLRFPRNPDDHISRAILRDGTELENSFTFHVASDETEQSGLVLTGACFFESPECLFSGETLTTFSKAQFDLRLCVTGRAIANRQSLEAQTNIRVVDADVIAGSFGDQSSVRLTKIDRTEIGGLIIVVGSYFKDRICAQTANFLYVARSGIGHVINVSDRVEEERITAVLCSENIQSDGSIGLEMWGYSKIVNFNMVSPEHIESAIGQDLGWIWTQSEQDYYLLDEFSVNHNEYSRVSLIELQPIRVLKKPQSALNPSIVSSNVISYLTSYSKYGISSAYIDKDTIIQILDIESQAPIQQRLGEDEMLESLIQAIQLAGTLSSASAKTVEEVKRLVALLKKAPEPSTENQPRIRAIVGVISKELDGAIAEFGRIKDVGGYSELEKDKYLLIVFEKSLKLLEASESLQAEIPDYSALTKFFSDFVAVHSAGA